MPGSHEQGLSIEIEKARDEAQLLAASTLENGLHSVEADTLRHNEDSIQSPANDAIGRTALSVPKEPEELSANPEKASEYAVKVGELLKGFREDYDLAA